MSCCCHKSAFEREFEFTENLFFWVLMIVAFGYMLKVLFWLLSRGLPWLLAGLWGLLMWIVSLIDRCFSLGLGVVEGWRQKAEGREAERRRRTRERSRVLQEKVALAAAAVDGPDPALSLKALEHLRDYAKEGSGEAALYVSRAFRDGAVVPRNDELADRWYAFFVRLQERARRLAEGGTDWRGTLCEQRFDSSVLVAVVCVGTGVFCFLGGLRALGAGFAVLGLLAGCLMPLFVKPGGRS